MPLTLGFQGTIRWTLETTEGAGFPTSPTMKLVADVVHSCVLRHKGERTLLYDIGDYVPKGVIEGTQGYELELRFPFQDHAQLYSSGASTEFIPILINRQANGRLQTMAFEIAAATDATTKAFYTLAGVKADSVSLEVSADGVWEWTVTLKFQTLTRATTEPVIAGATRNTTVSATPTYFEYVGASVAVEAPDATALAYATDRVGLRIAQNLSDVKNLGSKTIKTHAEGRREVTVTGTITNDDGGKALFDASIANTKTSVVFKLGAAGKPKFTIADTILPSFDLSMDNEAAVVSVDIERLASGTITLGTV